MYQKNNEDKEKWTNQRREREREREREEGKRHKQKEITRKETNTLKTDNTTLVTEQRINRRHKKQNKNRRLKTGNETDRKLDKCRP